MPRLVKYALYALVSVIGLVVLAVAVAVLIPDNVYRGWLISAVEKTTGRTLAIDGDFDIQTGTRLKLIANDISFANADWSSEPTMFSATQLEAAVELLPLLSGIATATLNVSGPKVLIETSDAGNGNWVMSSDTPPGEPPAPRQTTGTGIVLAPTIHLTDGRIDYRDGQSGRTERFDLASLDVETTAEQLKLALQGLYKEQNISLTGDLGATRAIAIGENTAVSLDGQFGETALAVEGNWSQQLAAAGPSLDLAVSVDNPALDTLSPFAGIDIPNLGPLDFGTRISGSGGAYVADDLGLLLDGPETKIDISGTVGNLVKLEGVDLNARAAASSLPAIIAGLDLRLPGAVPEKLEAAANISGSLAALALSNVLIKVDDQDLQANLSGSVEDIISQTGVEGTFEANSPSLAALSKFTGRELPASGPVQIGAELISEGETYRLPNLDLSIEGENIDATLNGSVADLLKLTGIDIDLNATIGSLAQFSAAAGRELPQTNPLTVTAKATASEGAGGPAQVSAKLQSDWLRGSVDATLTDVVAVRRVEGDLDLELQSLAVLSAFAGRELPPMGPIKAAGHLAPVEDTYALTDLDLAIQDPSLNARIQGTIQDLLTMGGTALDLDAKVGSLANLTALAGTELPDTKPLNIKAKAVVDEGDQGPAEITANIESEWLSADLKASLDHLLKAQGLNSELKLELQSLADLSSVVGRDLPSMGPIGASATLASSGDTYALSDLDLGIEDETLRAQLKGSIADLVAVQGIELALEGTISSLTDLSELAGADLPETPPIALRANVAAKEGIDGTAAVKANVSTDKVNAEVDGSITNLTTIAAARLNLALRAVSLADVGELAGTQLPEIGPLDASTVLNRASNEIDLVQLAATLGNSNLDGNVKVVLPTPETAGNITGLFRSKYLDLDEIMAASSSEASPEPVAASQPTTTAAPVESQSKQAQESGAGGEPLQVADSGSRVIPDTPLPVEFLNLYDAYITYAFDEIKTPDTKIENGQITADLQSGALSLEIARALVGDRPFTGGITVDGSRQPAPVTVELHAEEVPLSDIVGKQTILQGGRLLVDIDTSGAGNTLREVMGSLNGHASLAVRDTRLPGEALSRFGGDLISQINPLSAKQGYSEIECAAAAFDLSDGLATTPRGLVSRDTSATWIGSGEINLKTEEIKFELESKPREGLGLGAGSIAGLVQIGGTLANPTITPNPKGVAKAGAGTALAISTGGLSVLASGFLNKQTSESGVCEEIRRTILLGESPGTGVDPKE